METQIEIGHLNRLHAGMLSNSDRHPGAPVIELSITDHDESGTTRLTRADCKTLIVFLLNRITLAP